MIYELLNLADKYNYSLISCKFNSYTLPLMIYVMPQRPSKGILDLNSDWGWKLCLPLEYISSFKPKISPIVLKFSPWHLIMTTSRYLLMIDFNRRYMFPMSVMKLPMLLEHIMLVSLWISMLFILVIGSFEWSRDFHGWWSSRSEGDFWPFFIFNLHCKLSSKSNIICHRYNN